MTNGNNREMMTAMLRRYVRRIRREGIKYDLVDMRRVGRLTRSELQKQYRRAKRLDEGRVAAIMISGSTDEQIASFNNWLARARELVVYWKKKDLQSLGSKIPEAVTYSNEGSIDEE